MKMEGHAFETNTYNNNNNNVPLKLRNESVLIISSMECL